MPQIAVSTRVVYIVHHVIEAATPDEAADQIDNMSTTEVINTGEIVDSNVYITDVWYVPGPETEEKPAK